ncbi:hypothetical protein OEZ86_000943 [Tetradesmus obliquus]|nr:hypothetical protein OEZ86_000943 [Tetradesmus obliquus]
MRRTVEESDEEAIIVVSDEEAIVVEDEDAVLPTQPLAAEAAAAAPPPTDAAADTDAAAADIAASDTAAEPAAGGDGEAGSTCTICLDLLCEQGSHRPAALKCGHIFGNQCLRQWLQHKPRCPQCNKKAKARDITLLYNLPTGVAAGPGAAELEAQLQQERERTARLQEQLQEMQRQLAANKQQPAAAGALLLVGERQMAPGGGSSKLRKVSLVCPASPSYIQLPAAAGTVRGLASQQEAGLGSSYGSQLMAVATERAGLQLVSMASNNTVQSVPVPGPVWSVAWSLQHEHQLLMGLDKGRLAVADLRRSGTEMLLYISSGSSSSSADGARPQQPLHSLIVLHSWQLDALLQAQQGGGAGSKWQGARPEAIVACAGGVFSWGRDCPGSCFGELLPSSWHGGTCEGVALAADGSSLAASFRSPLSYNIAAGTPDNVVGLFELGDLQKIQAVLGEVDDPVYKDGKRPLHLAAIYGHTHIAQWLLSEGASVDAVDQGGHTPLHLASKYGHTQLLQLLLQHGAGVNAANRIYKMTPLHMAAKEGQRGSAEALVAAGADVKAEAKDGVQPLHICAEKGHREVAAVLITAGAAPNTKDAIGFTPLHLSIEHKNDSMVALLLKLGADPDIPNKNGWTPLHVAASNGSTAATRTLLEYGANVEATNSEGKTPLNLAVEAKHAAVVPLLNPAAAAALACPSLLASAAAAGAAADAPDGPLGPVRLPGEELRSIDSLLGGLGLKDSTGAACPFCCSLGAGTAAAGSSAAASNAAAAAAAPGSSSSSSGVPSLFLCPLSQKVLTDPVVACDGFTYDRRAIQEWFESGQRASPLTKQALRSTATLPNHVVRCAVSEWMEWREKRGAQLQKQQQQQRRQ